MELDDIHEYMLLAIIVVLITLLNSTFLGMSIFACICNVFFVFTFFPLNELHFSFGQIEADVCFHPGYNWKTTSTFVYGMTYVGYKIVIPFNPGNLPDTWLNQIEPCKVG